MALCDIISVPSYSGVEFLRHAARGLSNFARFHSNANTLVWLPYLILLLHSSVTFLADCGNGLTYPKHCVVSVT